MLNTPLLYRREGSGSPLRCHPLLIAPAQRLLPSGTAETCLALRKTIVGAPAKASACLGCLPLQRGGRSLQTGQSPGRLRTEGPGVGALPLARAEHGGGWQGPGLEDPQL